jgi:hypothetical protein
MGTFSTKKGIKMARRAVIEKEYIRSMREIYYYGEDISDSQVMLLPQGQGQKNLESYNQTNREVITNRGYMFSLLDEEIKVETLKNEKFEVIGWLDRTVECPFDFILTEPLTNKFYLAKLKGRTDGWPLFAIQNGQPTCSRSRMGSQWNCTLCVKYFGEVCKGR